MHATSVAHSAHACHAARSVRCAATQWRIALSCEARIHAQMHTRKITYLRSTKTFDGRNAMPSHVQLALADGIQKLRRLHDEIGSQPHDALLSVQKIVLGELRRKPQNCS